MRSRGLQGRFKVAARVCSQQVQLCKPQGRPEMEYKYKLRSSCCKKKSIKRNGPVSKHHTEHVYRVARESYNEVARLVNHTTALKELITKRFKIFYTMYDRLIMAYNRLIMKYAAPAWFHHPLPHPSPGSDRDEPRGRNRT